jgi:manganese peroxidase
MVNNQVAMQTTFEAAILKLSVLDHNIEGMVDCSEVIPVPKTLTKAAAFPSGLIHADDDQACATTPFPTISASPGPTTFVAPAPSS